MPVLVNVREAGVERKGKVAPVASRFVVGDGGRVGVVLLVDDEPSQRMLARVVLRPMADAVGADLLEAEDAPGALAALEGLPPETPVLVVSDVRLRGIDGVALVRAVRDRIPGRPVRFHLWSTWVDDRLRREAGDLGVEVATKPPSLDGLRAVLGAWLDAWVDALGPRRVEARAVRPVHPTPGAEGLKTGP